MMQGRYEILSLMGSFLPTDTGGGSWQRTGGLSVSLAGSDGRVIGGGVAGLLMAASPIQVRFQTLLLLLYKYLNIYKINNLFLSFFLSLLYKS